MSYSTAAGSGNKRGNKIDPQSPSQQSLLPSELNDSNKAIQAKLTKFQGSLRALELITAKIGTAEDNYEMR